jgi:hypothetical protein
MEQNCKAMQHVLSVLTTAVLLSWLGKTRHCCTAVLTEADSPLLYCCPGCGRLTTAVLLSWLRQTHHCCTAVLVEADIRGRCASHPDAAAVEAEEGRCRLRSYWRRSCWLRHESRMSVVLVLEFRHMRHRMMLYQLRTSRCYRGRSYQSVGE